MGIGVVGIGQERSDTLIFRRLLVTIVLQLTTQMLPAKGMTNVLRRVENSTNVIRAAERPVWFRAIKIWRAPSGLVRAAERRWQNRFQYGELCTYLLTQRRMTRAVIRVKDNRMRATTIFSALGLFLFSMHFTISLWASNQHYEGSWGYYYFVLPDFPVVLIIAAANTVFELESAWPLLIILGSIWWYFLGWLIARALTNRETNRGTDSE